MEVQEITIQLASDNQRRMYEFYRDVVQLPVVEGMGDHALRLGPGAVLFVVDHSEVRGSNANAARVIIDLHVNDLDAQQARLEAAGVKFLRSKGVEYWGGVISTFEDPDGNRIQLIEFRPELAREEETAAAR
mgnify:CR=1 FL=1